MQSLRTIYAESRAIAQETNGMSNKDSIRHFLRRIGGDALREKLDAIEKGDNFLQPKVVQTRLLTEIHAQ